MSTPGLDENVVQHVNDLGTTSWSGTTYRHTSRGRDPLSGSGAMLFGGRWNPAGVCSATYLAQPARTAALELDRLAAANGLDTVTFLGSPRELHTIAVVELDVLDLRTADALQFVGLNLDDIADDDWTACQSVGHAAYFLNIQGVIAPSAGGSGHVITVFDNRVRPMQLTVTDTQSLNEQTYSRIATS